MLFFINSHISVLLHGYDANSRNSCHEHMSKNFVLAKISFRSIVSQSIINKILRLGILRATYYFQPSLCDKHVTRLFTCQMKKIYIINVKSLQMKEIVLHKKCVPNKKILKFSALQNTDIMYFFKSIFLRILERGFHMLI